MASLLVVSLALRFTIRYCRPAAEAAHTRRQFDLLTCHLNTFMSLVGQGWDATPDSPPARIVTLAGWILGKWGRGGRGRSVPWHNSDRQYFR